MMMASIYYSLDYFSLSSNVKFFILMFTFSLLLNNTKCLSVANQQQNGPGAAPFDHHQRNTIDATNTKLVRYNYTQDKIKHAQYVLENRICITLLCSCMRHH